MALPPLGFKKPYQPFAERSEVDPDIVDLAQRQLDKHGGGATPGPQVLAGDSLGTAINKVVNPGGTSQVAPDTSPTSPFKPNPEGGQPAETEGTDDETLKALRELESGNRIFAHGGMQQGPTSALVSEGQNYHPLGGSEGKKNYDEAYDPNPTVNALYNGQAAQEDQNKAVTEHYAGEIQRQKDVMAAMAAKRQQSAAEEARQQQVLDQHVQHYTDDLANQGKFWQNPGNVISAIAYSLMPIFSNDPAVGVKLINQAIDRDMANRKDLANMHLGELRSNLGHYRKAMGDAEAGDMLAESESRRVAALDIERIGAEYNSPISRAKTEMLAATVRNQAAKQKGEAFARAVYVRSQVAPKAIADDMKASGRDGVGYSAFSQPYDVPKGTVGSAVAGQVAGTPSTASTNTKTTIAGPRLTALANSPNEAVAQAKRGQLTPADIEEVVNRNIAQRIASYHPVGSAAFNKEFEVRRAAAEKGVSDIAKAAQPIQARLGSLRSLQSSAHYIDNYYRSKGEDPNKFLSDLRTGTGAANAAWLDSMVTRYSTPTSSEDKEVREQRIAQAKLYQKLASEVSAFKNATIGGSQSKQELADVGQYINMNPDWDKLMGYVDNESTKSQQQLSGAIATSEDPNGRLLWLARNRGATLPRLDAPTISKK